MKPWPLSLVSALLLPACAQVRFDPDYEREAAQIQNVDYPANKIVGSWMQVGYEPMTPLMLENRSYHLFRADGTALCTSVYIIPPIFREYRDLYEGASDMTGEEILECDATWKYLGKNKWELRPAGVDRVISKPSWLKSVTSKPAPPCIVRYCNGKLFYLSSHSSAVSISSEADAKAKLAVIRSINDSRFRASLEAQRNRLRMQQSMQAPVYLQQQLMPPPGPSPYGMAPVNY